MAILRRFDDPDLAAALKSAGSGTAVTAILDRTVRAVGLDVFAIGCPNEEGWMALTWSTDWLSHYLESGLLETDPLVAEARRRMFPFAWSDVRQRPLAKEEAATLAQAAAAGYREGYCVPVHGPAGYLALASIAGDRDTLHPQERALLQTAMLLGHQRLVELEGSDQRGRPALTPRERECLLWVAEGRGDADIADILRIGETTVRFHVENAKRKLDSRTRAQAVARAIWRNLINP